MSKEQLLFVADDILFFLILKKEKTWHFGISRETSAWQTIHDSHEMPCLVILADKKKMSIAAVMINSLIINRLL